MKLNRIFALLLALMMLFSAACAEIVLLPIDESAGLPYDAEFQKTVTTYDDPSIHVERYSVMNKDTDYHCNYYYAYITIATPNQLRTASPKSFAKRSQAHASTMARRVNAVVAISGDYYGARSECYVLRQGVVYRDNLGDKLDVLLIDEDGNFHILLASENPSKIDKTTVDGKRVINALCFGPALIRDGVVVADPKAAPVMSAPESRGMRMVIAQLGPLQYMVLCCTSVGCRLDEIVNLTKECAAEFGHEVQYAYLLDGGISSQFVFLGKLINQPERDARDITDIIYFASAWKPED